MEYPYFHPEPSEEQRMIVDTVRDFSAEKVATLAAKIDAEREIPTDLLAELAELGLLAIPIPEESGGAGFDYVSYLLSLVELAAGSPSVALHVLSQTTLFLDPLTIAGGHDEIAAAVATGEARGALALHEEGGITTGDSVTTTAAATDGGWRIDGTKTMVLSGDAAGHYLVIAKDDSALGLWLVAADADGVSRSETRHRTGMRGLGACDVTFEGVTVEGAARLDIDRETIARSVSRAMVGLVAIGCGLLRSARDAALQYAQERKQFGAAIVSFDAIRERIGRMEEQYAVALSLTATGANLIDSGSDVAQFARIARNVVADGAMKAADHAVQVYGGYGYSREYPVERMYRDSRFLAVALGVEGAIRDASVRALMA